MKKITFLFSILLATLGYSQVGIGTTNPLEDLHIADPSGTIRIESLNSTNNALNDGVDPSPVFVDEDGNLTLGDQANVGGNRPLNFLIDVGDFIEDDPYAPTITGTGSVVNSPLASATATDTIATVALIVPQDAIVEVKYGVTLMITGNDLKLGCPCFYHTFDEAITMSTYFRVDLNNNGMIDGTEANTTYGLKGQYYETNTGGSIGYPYMNGQAYMELPAGTYTLFFYGEIRDSTASYTSVGFGGAQDYLKIRVYN